MDEEEKFAKGLFYLTGMFYHDQILQSYRMIFIGIQAVLFGFAYGLKEWSDGTGLEGVAAVGLAFCVLWIIITFRRGMYVWVWRDRLLATMDGTEAGDFLRKWEKGMGARGTLIRLITRYIFVFFLPSAIMVVWAVLLAIW